MTKALLPGSWMREARCAETDPETFFPEEGSASRAATQNARLICQGCPARNPCLMYAVQNNIKGGIFGGLTPRERRDVRAGRRSGA